MTDHGTLWRVTMRKADALLRRLTPNGFPAARPSRRHNFVTLRRRESCGGIPAYRRNIRAGRVWPGACDAKNRQHEGMETASFGGLRDGARLGTKSGKGL